MHPGSRSCSRAESRCVAGHVARLTCPARCARDQVCRAHASCALWDRVTQCARGPDSPLGESGPSESGRDSLSQNPENFILCTVTAQAVLNISTNDPKILELSIYAFHNPMKTVPLNGF